MFIFFYEWDGERRGEERGKDGEYHSLATLNCVRALDYRFHAWGEMGWFFSAGGQLVCSLPTPPSSRALSGDERSGDLGVGREMKPAWGGSW